MTTPSDSIFSTSFLNSAQAFPRFPTLRELGRQCPRPAVAAVHRERPISGTSLTTTDPAAPLTVALASTNRYIGLSGCFGGCPIHSYLGISVPFLSAAACA